MKEGSRISAGSCLGKAFLLLMNWKNRAIEQPDNHSLFLAPPSCSHLSLLAPVSLLFMGITASMGREG